MEAKPRQRKRGRLTKATPERLEAILADIANGLTKEQACACNGVSATSFREWERRAEFPDLRAKAQGLRIKALLAKQEAAAQAGDQWSWKHYTWSLEKIYRSQYGDSAALVLYEQNNYQLSEERAREIDARVERLLEDRERDDGGPAQ
jgi:uncharacterized protein YfiM (DUF2279 family)